MTGKFDATCARESGGFTATDDKSRRSGDSEHFGAGSWSNDDGKDRSADAGRKRQGGESSGKHVVRARSPRDG